MATSVNNSTLQIASRKNSPCKLFFSPTGSESRPKPTAAVKRLPKKDLKSSQPPSPLPATISGICNAIKADGKKCTYKAKCFSKDKKNKYCGVHSKFCK